ncbi:hypothetical protein JJE66_01500 [Bradyrhizobium diazoefficiens]|uniref:hypothetical protein n=1 Tax=Bradyrhizobium diazoefficiens TaxID=1355477 RepID=UPI0019096F06|nr:hypothetical protein [Bradyrhizobium diazoefficiens]MBK3659931.1 hypothetical protein [Bradyrhizobium diazoefficiens]
MFNIKITLGEGLAATTLGYVLAVASFNAGYFDLVPSRFVELFSFSDLVNANIPILQYVIGVYTTYCVLSLMFSIPKHFLSKGLDKLVAVAPLPAWSVDLLPLVALALFAATAILNDIHLNAINNEIFTIEFLPWAILFWFIFDFTLSSYRRHQMDQKSFLIAVIINAVIFCHISGKMWLKYEIRNHEGIQAMYLQSGECLSRKLLRSTGNGMLLYSFDLKQFEFRDRSSIRTIYGGAGCT